MTTAPEGPVEEVRTPFERPDRAATRAAARPVEGGRKSLELRFLRRCPIRPNRAWLCPRPDKPPAGLLSTWPARSLTTGTAKSYPRGPLPAGASRLRRLPDRTEAEPYSTAWEILPRNGNIYRSGSRHRKSYAGTWNTWPLSKP